MRPQRCFHWIVVALLAMSATHDLVALAADTPPTYRSRNTAEWIQSFDRAVTSIPANPKTEFERAQAAIEALAALAPYDRTAVGALERAARDKRFVSIACMGLAAAGHPLPRDVADNPANRTVVLGALVRAGSRGVPKLLQLVRNDWKTRNVRPSFRLSEEALPAVLRYSQSDDDLRRSVSAALLAAMQHEAEAALPALLRLAEADSERALRLWGPSLAQCSPMVSRLLVGMLEDDRLSPAIHALVTHATFDTDDADLTARLIAVAQSGAPVQASLATRVLSKLQKPPAESVPVFRRVALDAQADLALRIQAIRQLGSIPTQATIEALTELMTAGGMQAEAARALCRCGDDGIAALIEAWPRLDREQRLVALPTVARSERWRDETVPLVVSELEAEEPTLPLVLMLARLEPRLAEPYAQFAIGEIAKAKRFSDTVTTLLRRHAVACLPHLDELAAKDPWNTIDALGPVLVDDLRKDLDVDSNALVETIEILSRLGVIAEGSFADLRSVVENERLRMDARRRAAVALFAIDSKQARRLANDGTIEPLVRTLLQQAACIAFGAREFAKVAAIARYPGLANSSVIDFDQGLRQLMDMGSRGVPRLIELLQLPQDFLRWRVAAALGFLAGDAHAAIPALVQALDDDGSGRQHAISFELVHGDFLSSERLDARRAVARGLHQAIGDFYTVRGQAAWALLQMGDDGRIALERALENDATRRTAVLEALTELVPEVEALHPWIAKSLAALHDDELRSPQARALVDLVCEIGPRHFDCVDVLCRVVQCRAVSPEEWRSRERAASGLEALRARSSDVCSTVKSLAKEGDLRSLQLAESILGSATCDTDDDLEALRAMAPSESAYVRRSIIRVLASSEHPRRHELASMLLSDEGAAVQARDVSERRRVARLLYEIQEAARDGVGVPLPAELYERTLPLLVDRDLLVRWSAFRTVLAAGDADYAKGVRFLLEVLERNDAEACEGALDLLGLITCLRRSDHGGGGAELAKLRIRVRETVREQRVVMQSLDRLLHEESRMVALIELQRSQTRSPRIVQALVDCLAESDRSVRSLSSSILARIGADVLPPVLDAYREHGAEVLDGVTQVLAKLRTSDPAALAIFGDALASPNEELRRRARDVLHAARDAAIPTLAAVLRRGVCPQELLFVAEQLVDVAEPLGEPLLGMIDGLEDERDRKRAIWLLGRFGPEFVEPLIGFLRDPRADVRDAAVVALARQGRHARSALEPLTRLLSGEDDSVALMASGVLHRVGSTPKEVATAVAPLLEHEQAHTRASAAYALAPLGDAARDLIPKLRRLLTDPSEAVRLEAAHAILRAEPADAPAVAVLETCLAEASPEMLRRVLSRFLSLPNASAHASKIVRLLASDDPVVRRSGLWGLYNLGDRDFLPDIERLLEDPDQAIRAYARRVVDTLQKKR